MSPPSPPTHLLNPYPLSGEGVFMALAGFMVWGGGAVHENDLQQWPRLIIIHPLQERADVYIARKLVCNSHLGP